MKPQTTKLKLGLAGEYLACAELLKRGYTAHLTFGNAKAVDILVKSKTHSNIYSAVEVKHSTDNKYCQTFCLNKYWNPNKRHPDYWILIHTDVVTFESCFYVLTHNDVLKLQMQVNGVTSLIKSNGYDKIPYTLLAPYKNNWTII